MRAGLRWRRSRVALLAVIVAVAAPIVVGAGGPVRAVPERAAAGPAVAGSAGPGASVTLVTGDRVAVRAGREPQVRPGAGREKVRFQRYTERGDTYVVPADAAALVAAGRLDRRLFNVTKLIEYGYDDRSRADLPLIADGGGGPSRSATASARAAVTGEGMEVTRELPSIGGVAVRADKAGAAGLWDRLRGSVPAGRAPRTLAGGLERVWLDGPVRAALDHSAPQIGAPAAWRAGHTAAGVTVAVLDSGVDPAHPDLAGAVAEAVDFTGSASGARDRHGHGTHVASIVTGSGAAAGGRYAGVAPDARLLVGKVLDDFGSGSEADIIAGMQWAAGRARVVNLSLGSAWPSDGTDPMSQALNRLSAETGTLFVVAAGNSGPHESIMGSPAAADAALTVGAVNRRDELAEFSSRGPRWIDKAIKPDITAPGVDVVAARAEDAAIGPPVEDGYLRLSGTSMAAPHAAGAAAILAGQHPDWTAGRLKSALMGSAAPAADLTVYQQGAGRADLARATAQAVSATPASLSQGIARWPHGDDEPVTRTVTYHNHGNRDVTLRLGFEVRDPAGNAPPAGMFAVSHPQVTVPANGTAAVTVTTDTAVHGPDGTYGGALTAASADGQTRVRTPIGVVREVESYDLSLTFLGHDGQPAVDAITRIVDIQHGGALLPPNDPSGTVVARLPKGHYYFESTISTPPEAGTRDPGGERWYHTDTVEPNLEVDRDATMVVDARAGKPLGLLVDQPTARLGWADIEFVRVTPWGVTGMGLTVPDFERMFVRPSRTAAPGQFEFIVAGILAEPDQAGGFAGSPYQYHVAWWADGSVPAKLVRRFHDRDLAKVQTAIAASAPGKTGVKDLAGAPLPSRLTEFYGPGRWAGSLHQFAGQDQEESESVILGLQRTYDQGGTAVERWNQAVHGPAFPVIPGEPAAFAGRVGDELRFDLPLFTDQAADRFGFSRADGDLVLHRDGQRVGASGAPGQGSFTVPGGPASYRLESEAVRSGVSELSTRVSTAWTFRSDTVQGSEPEPLPLLAVRFAPSLDNRNRATSGQAFLLPIYLQRNGDQAAPAAANLTVEVSYDDGQTWSPARLIGSGDRRRAVVTHPPGQGFVSLRASATDTDGNRVEQTIIRAYALKR